METSLSRTCAATHRNYLESHLSHNAPEDIIFSKAISAIYKQKETYIADFLSTYGQHLSKEQKMFLYQTAIDIENFDIISEITKHVIPFDTDTDKISILKQAIENSANSGNTSTLEVISENISQKDNLIYLLHKPRTDIGHANENNTLIHEVAEITPLYRRINIMKILLQQRNADNAAYLAILSNCLSSKNSLDITPYDLMQKSLSQKSNILNHSCQVPMTPETQEEIIKLNMIFLKRNNLEALKRNLNRFPQLINEERNGESLLSIAIKKSLHENEYKGLQTILSFMPSKNITSVKKILSPIIKSMQQSIQSKQHAFTLNNAHQKNLMLLISLGFDTSSLLSSICVTESRTTEKTELQLKRTTLKKSPRVWHVPTSMEEAEQQLRLTASGDPKSQKTGHKRAGLSRQNQIVTSSKDESSNIEPPVQSAELSKNSLNLSMISAIQAPMETKFYDAYKRDQEGNTVLHRFAKKSGISIDDFTTIEHLLDIEEFLHLKNNAQETVLFLLRSKFKHASCIAKSVDNQPVDIKEQFIKIITIIKTIPDSKGSRTQLSYDLIEHINTLPEHTVKTLLTLKEGSQSVGLKRHTLLSAAYATDNFIIVDFLFEKGANPNLQYVVGKMKIDSTSSLSELTNRPLHAHLENVLIKRIHSSSDEKLAYLFKKEFAAGSDVSSDEPFMFVISDEASVIKRRIRLEELLLEKNHAKPLKVWLQFTDS